MPITKLHLTNVGPFDEIEFEFDRQVNVFTGPNNSGKSSALWALGDIAVYPFNFPEKLLRSGMDAEFHLHVSGGDEREFADRLPIRARVAGNRILDDAKGGLTEERFHEYLGILEMIGFSKFIPALRWSTDFRSPGPTVVQRKGNETVRRPMPATDDPELRKRLSLVSESASIVSDEAVIQKIIDLDYRSYIRQKPGFGDIAVAIGEIASEITDGFPLRFAGVNEDDDGFFPEFETVDGLMPLNTLSQGTQSIIQWLAHLLIGYAEYYDFPDDLSKKPGVLIIDEIDAHLHPSWQRRIIPALTGRFPNLQIFCSTHSPLMLAGLDEGQVQLLRRDEDGRVTVSRNERDLTGWSADEILRHFLDLPDPTDLESVGHLERYETLLYKVSLSPEEAEEKERLSHIVRDDLMRGPMFSQAKELAKILNQARTETSVEGALRLMESGE